MFGKKKKTDKNGKQLDGVQDSKRPLQYNPGTTGNAEVVKIKLLEAINLNLLTMVHLLSDIKEDARKK